MSRKILAVLVLCLFLVACSAETTPPLENTPEITTPVTTTTPSVTTTTPSVTTTTPSATTTTPSVTTTTTPPPDPEPPRDEIRILWNENGLSLIEDEETELTKELLSIIKGFLTPLILCGDECCEDGKITLGVKSLINFHREYEEAGLIEPAHRTHEEWQALDEKYNHDGRYGYLKIENLELIFNDIFSKNADNITLFDDVYECEFMADGLVGVGVFGITESYNIILKEQSINDEKVELYFYYFFNSIDGVFKDSGYDSEDIGRWDNGLIFYEDALDTLGVVKYTFVLEDGRYKILSIENVT